MNDVLKSAFRSSLLTSACLLVSGAVAFAASPAPNASSSPIPNASPSSSANATLTDPGVYTISGQNLTWNQRSGDFSIPADVKFTQPGTDVTGDHATGNSLKKMVKITGHVLLHNSKPVSTIGISARNASNEPQTLSADELDVNGPAKLYTAIGNVKFSQGTKVVTAQRGELDELKHMLTLTGDVHVDDTSSGQSMVAENVTYDTQSETVTATGKPGEPFQIRSRVQNAPAPIASAAPTKAPRKRR